MEGSSDGSGRAEPGVVFHQKRFNKADHSIPQLESAKEIARMKGRLFRERFEDRVAKPGSGGQFETKAKGAGDRRHQNERRELAVSIPDVGEVESGGVLTLASAADGI